MISRPRHSKTSLKSKKSTPASKKDESKSKKEDNKKAARPSSPGKNGKTKGRKTSSGEVSKNSSQYFSKPSPNKPAPKHTVASKSLRLNKLIADSGLCSRRKADELISDGKVIVNGKRVNTLGASANPAHDEILVNGKPLPVIKPLYLAFHKPRGYITTRHDELDRKTIYALLPEKWHSVDPAGRLDKDSSGILILSNDGDFINRITHPRYQCNKRYRITTEKPLNEAAAQHLINGVLLQPENKLAKIENLKALPVETNAPKEWPYELTLQTGYNRQIRRSFEAVGFPVLKLKRVAFGNVKLGQLKAGDLRPLKPFEIQQLLKPSSHDALKSARPAVKTPRKSKLANEKPHSVKRSGQGLPKPKRKTRPNSG
ncbi:MAG: pseudouridine synthase [Vampirovibrionales bacterium]|nr:pseudouridine synthase [Vampirovibrionales bacterium]